MQKFSHHFIIFTRFTGNFASAKYKQNKIDFNKLDVSISDVIMDAPEDCRICSKAGQYDLFNDELSFDMKEMNKIKIYIVLNNFLYEKVNSHKIL